MPKGRPEKAKNRVRLSEFVADVGVLLQTSERVGTPESPILLHMLYIPFGSKSEALRLGIHLIRFY